MELKKYKGFIIGFIFLAILFALRVILGGRVFQDFYNGLVITVICLLTSYVIRYGKKGTKIKRDYMFAMTFLILVLVRL